MFFKSSSDQLLDDSLLEIKEKNNEQRRDFEAAVGKEEELVTGER